jgi:imidazolonepropionase-like amidohydrolase
MRSCTVAWIASLAFVALPAGAGEEDLPNTPPPLAVHALTHARVVRAAGDAIDDATIVLRDGRIEAAGAGAAVPPDARVWDLAGRTVYPGLLDPLTGLGFPEERPGPRERRRPPERTEEEPPRAAGPSHPIASVHPETRAADQVRIEKEKLEAWRAAGFTAAVTAPASGIFRGSAALLNLGDGRLNENLVVEDIGQLVGFEAGGFRSREYPGSVMGVMATIRQVLLDAEHHRAAGAAYQARPQAQPRPPVNRALAALEPVTGGRERVIFAPDDLLGLVRAAGLLEEFHLAGILVGSGAEYRHLDWVRAANAPLILPVDFPPPPAVGDDGPALDIPTDALRHWRRAPENPGLLHEAGIPFALTARGLEKPGELRGKVREAIERGLPAGVALDALTRMPARLYGVDDRLGTIEPGKIANLTVTDGDLFAKETKIVEVWIDGRRYDTSKPKKEGEKDRGDEGAEEDGKDREKKTGEGKGDDAKDGAKEEKAPEIPWAPPPGPLAEPPGVLVRGATIWTQGAQGKLEDADLVVAGGRIEAVGRDLRAPRGAMVIDGGGRHVTPGLIDAHSHSATAESVNESTRSVTAEVRVADVLNPDDAILYRLLAGGLTAGNVLHGSANAIGGQSAVVKWRTGVAPREMLIPDAPAGIKFALGENPKRSNSGEEARTRYPQTREGVHEVIRQTFLAARDYLAAWERWEREGKAAGDAPPRRDLQLEAIAEVLQGRRLVHAHSYRQDEILALLLLADELGIRIATFQHVLEGYKVAHEIAARGSGASTFSDWWAYKFEVYDAIPYNGAIMHGDGVVVSFNSDSDELARRLNLEAAKAVKYGGVPEVEALDFVTRNPARQLGIDGRVGALEPGKDADFVVWSGDPLSTRSVVDQTWIEGVLYFDRERDPAIARSLAAERDALVEAARAAAKKEGKKGRGPGGRGRDGEEGAR